MNIKNLIKLLKLGDNDAPVCIWVKDDMGRVIELDPEKIRIINGRLVIDLKMPMGSVLMD